MSTATRPPRLARGTGFKGTIITSPLGGDVSSPIVPVPVPAPVPEPVSPARANGHAARVREGERERERSGPDDQMRAGSGAQVEGAVPGRDRPPAGLDEARGQRLAGAREGPGHPMTVEQLAPLGPAAVEDHPIARQLERGVGVEG